MSPSILCRKYMRSRKCFKSQELFGRSIEHMLKLQNKEQQAELEQEMKGDVADAEELLTKCQSDADNQDEVSQTKGVAGLYGSWVEETRAMIALSHQSKGPEAIKLFYEKVDPAFDEYLEATEKFESN